MIPLLQVAGPRGENHPDVDALIDAALLRAGAAERASHRHDVLNALTAIEGAASVLASDTLSVEDRVMIGGLLESGVEKLRLLCDENARVAGSIGLATIAREVVREPRWKGRVAVDVDLGLEAVGWPGHIAEALRQLLAAGEELAPGKALELTGRRDGGSVGLWLHLGNVRRASSDLPDTFHVAPGLVRDQGGEVRIETGAAGIAAIGLCLPAVTVAAIMAADPPAPAPAPAPVAARRGGG